MKKRGKAFDGLDELYFAAKKIRTESLTPSKSEFSGCISSVSKEILALLQHFKVITYRESRHILKLRTKNKLTQKKLIALAESRLPFKPLNWVLFWIHGAQGINLPKLFPQTADSLHGRKSHLEEMTKLLESDLGIQELYRELEYDLIELTKSTTNVIQWIQDQFSNGSLEAKIQLFKNKTSQKRQTTISKGLVANLINPRKAQGVKGTGELPDLSLGERQALQFLLGKVNNMTERELYLKTKLLDGIEDPQRDGYFVIFEKTEALRQSYGNVRLDGYHYENLEKSLVALQEKKRKLFIKNEKETLELSIALLQKLEIRHKLHEEPEFRDYVAVRIPYDVVQLHDNRYTTYPTDHFPLIRNTPPKTRLAKTEVRFFDFLRDEAPYKKSGKKCVRRKKESFLELIGGLEVVESRHKMRLARQIEDMYIPKAVNMNLLADVKIETNSEGETVYVFEYP